MIKDAEFKVSDYDIRLPELGFMKFAKNEDDEDGSIYLMYFKMDDIHKDKKDITSPGIRPYCFMKVPMGIHIKFLDQCYYNKLIKSAKKLRLWLINEDSRLTEIRSLNREVKY